MYGLIWIKTNTQNEDDWADACLLIISSPTNYWRTHRRENYRTMIEMSNGANQTTGRTLPKNHQAQPWPKSSPSPNIIVCASPNSTSSIRVRSAAPLPFVKLSRPSCCWPSSPGCHGVSALCSISSYKFERLLRKCLGLVSFRQLIYFMLKSSGLALFLNELSLFMLRSCFFFEEKLCQMKKETTKTHPYFAPSFRFHSVHFYADEW